MRKKIEISKSGQLFLDRLSAGFAYGNGLLFGGMCAFSALNQASKLLHWFIN